VENKTFSVERVIAYHVQRFLK